MRSTLRLERHLNRIHSCIQFRHNSSISLGWMLFAVLAPLWTAGTTLQAQTASFSYAQAAVSGGWLNPSSTAVDANGNVYIADTSNNAVKQILAVNGVLPASPTILTLGSSFSTPTALALDANGDLYVADKGNGAIKEIVATKLGVFPASPTIVTLATGLVAPSGLAVDSNGNLFFSQQIVSKTAIQEILATSVGVFPASPTIITIGSAVTWNNPVGVAVDQNGNVYVAGNQSQTVSEILKASEYATVLPLGGSFTAPTGIAVDANGDVFVADSAAGTVSEIEAVGGTIPASPTVVSLGAGWVTPVGLSVDSQGDLFVADRQATNGVQQIMTSRVVFGSVNVGIKSNPVSITFTFATGGTIGKPAVLTQGTAGLDFADTQTGTCTSNGIAFNWVANSTCTVVATLTPAYPGTQTGAVELLDSTGKVLAIAYLSGTGIGPVAGFSPASQSTLTVTGLGATGLNNPSRPVYDAQGNLYVADTGNSRVVMLAQPVAGSAAATVVATGVAGTTGVTLDGAGNLYMVANGNSIQKYTPSGVLSTLDNNGLTYLSVAVAVDASGNVYTADVTNNRILWFPAGGHAQVFYSGGPLSSPYGLAVDSLGNVYVANYGGNNVVEISQGVASILSSTYSFNSSSVSYSNPMDLALDNVGNIYVSDTGNNRMVLIPAGTNSALALNTGVLSLPDGAAVSRSGNLAMIDGATGAILVSSQEVAPTLTFPNTAPGATSSSQSLTLLNLGNGSLAFAAPTAGSNPSLSANFTAGASTCPSVTAGGTAQNLSTGSFCEVTLSFSPTSTGTVNGSLVLTDNASNGSTQTVSLNGIGIAPIINLMPAAGILTDGKIGIAYSQQFTASGGKSPYTYAMTVTNGSLPVGITFNAATGVLSGTPTGNGAVSFSITATDSSSVASGGPYTSSAQAYSFNVPNSTISMTPSSLSNGTAGASYGKVTFASSGGNGPYSYAVSSGALPTGLQLVAGVLSGTPTAVGVFSFTITGTDSLAKTGNQEYSINIGAPSIGLSPSGGALADGTAETVYSQQFTASGGTAPYTYTLATGALPSGMALSTNGAFTGTPVTAGSYNFTVQASDSTTGSGAPYATTRAYSLNTYAPIVSVIPMNGLLAGATVGQTNYSLTYSAKGGNGSYTYALTGGALPTGMNLTGGVLAGTPTAVGNFSFTITATDGEMFTGSKTYSLSVVPPTIAIAPANAVLNEGSAEVAYSPVTFAASSTNGGTAPYLYSISAGGLPKGMVLSAGGVLTGTPSAAGTFYFTVTATDANAQTGSREFVLAVAPPIVAITTVSLLDAAVGIPYSQIIAASGGSGSYIFTASGLPSWLTLDSTGLLHGTPSVGNIGGDEFTVTATDADGFTGIRTFTPNVYRLAVIPSGAQDLGTVTMGSTASTGTVTFSFNGVFALGATPVAVLTQGAAGLDFSDTTKGSCVQGTYGLTTATCTVKVAFNPQYPGVRLGAVELIDSNGTILATQPIYGTGKGAEANFLPGIESTVTSSIPLKTPGSLAVDASGNLYLSDSGLGQVLQLKQGTTQAVMSASAGLGSPQGVAVDGAGNVYIADSTNNTIWKVSASFGTATALTSATVNTANGGLNAPRGVAVDGAGNLYIADTGNGRILETSPSEAGGYTTPAQIPTYTALKAPYAVAVDRNGSLYIADFSSNVILIEPAGGTQSALGNQDQETKISTGVSAPVGVSVDVNNNVYIANSTGSLLKANLTAQGGYAAPVAVSTVATLSSPSGVAVDGSGEIFIADSPAGKIYEENYTAPPAALTFPTATAKGSKDTTDGALGFTLLNFGNADLNSTAATGIVDTTNSFSYDAAKDCFAQGNALSANSTCVFSVDFAPSLVGSPITGSLGLTYNNLAVASTSNSIPLSGTGVSPFVFAPASGSALTAGMVGVAYTQAIAVSSGGTAPFTYAVTNGALPAGLTLSTTGTLSGTAQSSGTFDFTVAATDKNKIDGSALYSLTVAQAATVPTVTENSPTQQTITFNFNTLSAVASIKVLTQGVTGLDFTNSGTGTCIPKAYNLNDQCTVVVAFAAKYPGTRYGAIELLDASGNILATQYISAVGTGPLALFSPGVVGSLSLKDVSTLGSSKTLNVPGGLAIDPVGNIYIADILNDRVLKVATNGTATTVATAGIQLHYPTGVALDGAGNLYIADNGDGQVVEVTPAGSASILDNGALTLTNNFSVAVDGNGNVYTTDLGNTKTGTAPRIVKYPGGGTAQLFAITGVTLTSPNGVALDGAGNLWVADNNTIVKVTGGAGATVGTGTLSTGLSAPLAIALDGIGNLYIADSANQRILELPAGSADMGSSQLLNLASASLSVPFGLAISGAGDLYIADAAENSVVVSNQEDAPEFDFDSTVGVTSTDQTFTLMNVGNSALTIGAPASAGNNPSFANTPSLFALDTSTTCPQVQFGATSATLAAAHTCLYALNFTPTATGTVSDSLKLTDNSHNVTGATQTLALTGATISVSPGSGTPTASFTLPAGTVGVAYNSSLAVTFTASGGAGPYCFGVSSGSLPRGLSLSPDGVLSGTPTVAGSYTFNVKAVDKNGKLALQAYTLVVNAPPIALSPAGSTLPTGMVLVAYSQNFSANGGTIPYSFAVTGGSLPKGLALSRGGELTGIPTSTASPASFTITATDQLGQTGTQAYSLIVNQPPISISPASGSPTALPVGTALIVYSQSFSASGGTPPFTYALAVNSGSIPAGLSLDAHTGILSGTPTDAGIVNFTVTATDSSSGGPFTGSQSYALTIAPPKITVMPGALPNGAVGAFFSQTLVGNGGGGPYTFSVTAGSLPAGVSLNGAILSGTPTTAGVSAGFTISATDTVSGAIGIRSYTPTIYAAPATAAPTILATPQAVGTSNASPITVTFTFHGSSVVGGFAEVTQGAANLDFRNAHSGSCTITEYNDGNTCTLNVIFKPLYPGQRNGAVELLDANGNILGAALVSGTATGPVANFIPATETTIASASSSIALQAPRGLAVDASGNVFIADGHSVLRLTAAGTISTVLDLSASSGQPTAVAMDGAGNLYVADSANNAIWREASPYTGTPTLVTSNSVNPPNGGLTSPGGVAVDASGNVFFSSTSGNKVYEALSSSTTGYSTPVQIATYSALSGPSGLAVDASGNLYIADSLNNRVLIEPVGGSTAAAQETIVGSSATLNLPTALAVDLNGNISIANNGAKNVLKAVKTGNTYATPTIVATMPLQAAYGVALDGAGNLYLSDTLNKTLIKENYGNARVQQFAQATQVGSTDTVDGPAAVSVLNFGNATLTANALASPSDFVQVAGSGTPLDCTATFSLGVNGSCNLSIAFLPASVGTLNEAFVLNDNSLNSGATQQIRVSGTGLTPLNLTWAAPAPIAYGTALGSQQLNATAGSVAGTLVYTPAAGTVLNAGNHTLSVTFTPTDGKDYSAITMTVPLQVTEVASAASIVTSLNPTLYQGSVTFTATIASAVGTPTGTVSFLDGTTSLGSGTLSGGTATFSTATLIAGTHTITAVYGGDTNFTGATSAAISQVVIDFSVAPTGSVSGSGTQIVTPDGAASFQLAIAPTTGATFPTEATLTVTGLPQNATIKLLTAGWVQQSNTTWTLPANTTLSDLLLAVQLSGPVASQKEPTNPFGHAMTPVLLGMLLLPFSGRLRRAGKRLGRKGAMLLLLMAVSAAMVGLNGCSADLLISPQTYNLTVTVHAGSLKHSTPLTLSVK